MPTAEQATATLHLTQADIESLVSFKSIAAKKATKYGSDELTKVRLTVLTDRWEVRATDSFTAAHFVKDHRETISVDTGSEELSVLLDKDGLDQLKKTLVTATPSQREDHPVTIDFHLMESGATYLLKAASGEDTVEVEAEDTEGHRYPNIDRLFPTEFDEIDHASFDPARLAQISQIVMPHEVGISKNSRDNALRLDFAPMGRHSSSRVMLVRKLTRNWPDGQMFQAAVMGVIDSALIPSAFGVTLSQ